MEEVPGVGDVVPLVGMERLEGEQCAIAQVEKLGPIRM